jgi:hypothetical protein
MGVRHPARLRGVAGISGRQADLVAIDELVHDADGRGVVTERDELELDAQVAAAAAEIRRRRPLENVRGPAPIETVMRAARLLKVLGPELVAEMTGLAPVVVSKIADGTHPTLAELKKHRRCPGCGGLVKGECRACALTAKAG